MDTGKLGDLVRQMRAVGTDLNTVEVKAAKSGFPKSVLETICAFSNSSGGVIIFGLDETQNFSPVQINASAISDAVSNVCATSFNLPIVPIIEHCEFEGQNLVVVAIDELAQREKPCYIRAKGGMYSHSYIRSGDGDRRMTGYEVDRLLEGRSQPTWDIEPVVGATIDDLDATLVARLLEEQRRQHPRIFTGEDVHVLRMLQVLAPGDISEKPVPTLAGLLALGVYPQKFLPRATVTCVAYPGADKAGVGDRRYNDNQELIGSIPEQVAGAIEFVRKNSRQGAVIVDGFRQELPDYPIDAVREAVTNALMHRDYSPEGLGQQVQLNMYVDRLEIHNPGGLYGGVTVDTLGTAGISATRNQYLSRLLEITPFEKGRVAENRGTGFQVMFSALEQAKMPKPIVSDNLTSFRITFPRRLHTSAEAKAAGGRRASDAVVEHLGSVMTASVRELAAVAGISVGGMRRVVGELVHEGVLERTEPARSPKQRYRLKK